MVRPEMGKASDTGHAYYASATIHAIARDAIRLRGQIDRAPVRRDTDRLSDRHGQKPQTSPVIRPVRLALLQRIGDKSRLCAQRDRHAVFTGLASDCVGQSDSRFGMWSPFLT